MATKYVLTGSKVFATLSRVFSSGVEYSEDELSAAGVLKETSPAGLLYFTQVDSATPPDEAPPATDTNPSVETLVADKEPSSPLSDDAGKTLEPEKEADTPKPDTPKAGKTIFAGGKKSAAPAPDGSVTV